MKALHKFNCNLSMFVQKKFKFSLLKSIAKKMNKKINLIYKY